MSQNRPTIRRTAASPSPSGTSDTHADVPSLKVVIVGDYGVGKTSLIRQLTQRQFLANSGTTIGVEFKEQRFPNAVLQIWDIAGQQYMSTMTKQYYRWSSAAIVCVDLSKESTFEVALDWRRDVMEKVGCAAMATATSGASSRQGSPQMGGGSSSPPGKQSQSSMNSTTIRPNEVDTAKVCDIPIFLFVNKSDLMSQTSHTRESLYKFALENGFTDMLLTSAKDYQNVFQAFQHVATFVVETQESHAMDGARSTGASAVNLNSLRRSVRPGTSEGDIVPKKSCCN